jgi:pimeloyl-ACP methyl ester carboxylesterase
MTRTTTWILPLGLAVLSLVSPAQASSTGLSVRPCNIPGISAPARCGTFKVWENRETRKGRKIAIRFYVVPAPGAARATEAVAFFSGGPGEAATDSAPWVTAQLVDVRDGRDLLFVDLRGTGGSHPLRCKSAKPSDPQSYLKEFYTPEDVARCARELRSRADVTQYHTAPAVDDVEDLRATLGYERLDLYGGSYGTRTALVYLRRHPQHVRVILMHGSVPTDLRYPLTVPRDAQLAFDGVRSDCEHDAACRAAFPDVAADLAASLRRFESGSVKADVLDAKRGATTTVTLSRDRYTEGIRSLLYQASGSSLIPAVVHRAAQGDFGPAAEEELAWRMEIEAQYRGVHLAVTCSEDVDFIDPAEAQRAAEGTFMTAWRAVDQKAACAVWPHRKLDRSVLEPVRSAVPLLILNGAYDPATASYHAERLAQGFPNSRVVIIPSAGHGTSGLVGLRSCYDRLVTGFIRTADAKGLDASCMSAVHRPPFPTEFPGGKVIAVDAASLRRFAGTYSSPEDTFEIRFEHGKLQADASGEKLTLLPIGPSRFRLLESPHAQVTFRDRDGEVTALELANGGAPVETFPRVDRKKPAPQPR